MPLLLKSSAAEPGPVSPLSPSSVTLPPPALSLWPPPPGYAAERCHRRAGRFRLCCVAVVLQDECVQVQQLVYI
eukprot:11012-Heterococcus_DN1.PRE.1